LWKAKLADLAADTGLDITVCHFPPGTSKWNKIEHRLFSHITLNWRGRPLTSHEVVVNTIASTRTSTGLSVAAELDTGTYPLGISVSKQRMQALPLAPHAWCGSWNYTLGAARTDPAQDPTGQQAGSLTEGDRSHARTRALEGVVRSEAHRHQPARARGVGGRPRSRASRPECAAPLSTTRRTTTSRPWGRQPSLLTDPARVLITIVYLRQICSQNVLSEILEVNPNSIGQAIAETRQLLDDRGHNICATTLRFSTARALTDFLDHGATSQRPSLPAVLSAPALTGMTRPELDQMIERLSAHQAARLEWRRYRRRGAERLPGARGGVFQQKITHPERVLATILYQRRVCTRQTLAELFDVSARTIGNALLEIRLLLEQDNYLPIPVPGPRFSTAAALLSSIGPNGPLNTDEPPC